MNKIPYAKFTERQFELEESMEENNERKCESPGEKVRTRGRLTDFIANIYHGHIVRIGRILGLIAFFLDNRHRRIVRRNLRFAYPGCSEEQVRRLTRKVFQNTGITILEILHATCFSVDDILRRVRIKGAGFLRDARLNPNGAIMISAHIGNWEMSVLATSILLQRPLVAVARMVYPEVLNRWINGLRTRFGSVLLEKKGALSTMSNMLRKGNVLGLLIDQGTKFSEGIEVKFFGRTVTATPAAALLARRYDSPVFPVYCIRGINNGLTLVVDAPLALEKTRDSRADLKANTQIMTHAIEEIIRKYPEQWFWFHKRWKRHYPQLYPEDLGRKERRRQKKMARIVNDLGESPRVNSG